MLQYFVDPTSNIISFCLRGSDADYLYGVIVSLKKAIHVIFWQHLTVFINIIFVSLRRWVDKGSKIPIQGRIRSEKLKKKVIKSGIYFYNYPKQCIFNIIQLYGFVTLKYVQYQKIVDLN